MSRKIDLMCSPQDADALRPVLEQLRKKGIHVNGLSAGENGIPAAVLQPAKAGNIVLAALSENFFADGSLTDALLGLIGAGVQDVLPLKLDDSPLPEPVQNALFARNILFAEGRDSALIAERIADALPRKKSRLPLILGAAGIVLIAAAGIWFWRAGQTPEEPEVPAAAAEEKIAVPGTPGLTEEELAQIDTVVIVGDLFRYSTMAEGPADFFTYTYSIWDVDTSHWYSNDDGHEYQMTHYDDLTFLSRMPNLHTLHMALVDADASALPDLSGMMRDGAVWIADCNIDDLSWLEGCRMRHFLYNRSAAADFSPLTACPDLVEAGIDLCGQDGADFSGFTPPSLVMLRIHNAQLVPGLDLSGLAGLEKVTQLDLSQLHITDLSFLAGMPAVEKLVVEYMDSLRDISAVGELKNLKDLTIGYSPDIRDYSSIAGCSALESILIHGDFNSTALQDASFFADLPKLHVIQLYACDLRDMDFLRGIASHQSSIDLAFAGEIRDYSGLSAIREYGRLHITPRGSGTPRGGDFSAVLPYIQDAKIDFLTLYACAGVDLAALPDDIGAISIQYGDLSDLSGLKPYSLSWLELRDCQYLQSLDGLENLPVHHNDPGKMNLAIAGCPRLSDFSALDGADLARLDLRGLYTMPDFSTFSTINLRLESMEELQNLHGLDTFPEGSSFQCMELVGLDQIQDLSPLRRFRIEQLQVPPQVAEQAEELMEDGIIGGYEVVYPDGSWQPFDGAVELLSLDELETLPKALLKRVECVRLVGDTLVGPEQGDIRDVREDGKNAPSFALYKPDTDEPVPIECGEGILTDPGIFGELAGLRELRLYAQPLETLQGIQALSSLAFLDAAYCPALTDASAAFACPKLEHLNLCACPVESIQGVQNLKNLTELKLNDTRVSDLTPLLELPDLETVRVSANMEEAVASLDGQDYHFTLEVEGG